MTQFEGLISEEHSQQRSEAAFAHDVFWSRFSAFATFTLYSCFSAVYVGGDWRGGKSANLPQT